MKLRLRSFYVVSTFFFNRLLKEEHIMKKENNSNTSKKLRPPIGDGKTSYLIGKLLSNLNSKATLVKQFTISNLSDRFKIMFFYP